MIYLTVWKKLWSACLSKLQRLVKAALLIVVYAYQAFLSVWVGGNCRFYPSCSEYAKDALHSKSVFTALKLILHRLRRCHPLGDSGFDPVPLHERGK